MGKRAHANLIQVVAVVVSGIYLGQTTVLATAAESNLWSDRRKSQQFAGLPVAAPASFLAAMPEVKSQLVSAASRGVPDWVQTAVAPFASIYSVHRSENPNAATVLLMQDAHLHAQAQTNIAGAIEALSRVSEENGRALTVGLEGARAGNIDISRYRFIADADTRRAIAMGLIRARVLNGAEAAAIASPELHLNGVEDWRGYEANVKALRSAAPSKKPAKKALDDLRRALADAKKNHFDPPLSDFDAKHAAYEEGTLGLPEYAAYLDSIVPAMTPNLRALNQAAMLERALDFRQAERARDRLIRELVPTLSEKETKLLVGMSAAFREGRITSSYYYEQLKTVAAAHGLPLSHYPELNLYIQYAIKTESIDHKNLFQEIRDLENRVRDNLAKTAPQRELVSLSADLHLLLKLVDSALTEDEWHAYDDRREQTDDMESRLANAGAAVPATWKDFAARRPLFEAFYAHALRRNKAMVENVARGTRHGEGSISVLVAGGFHTDGLKKLFADRGLNVVVMSPNITALEDGPSSLDILVSGRRPLDEIFVGERLFLPTASVLADPAAPIVPVIAATAKALGNMGPSTPGTATSDGVDVTATPKGTKKTESHEGLKFEVDGKTPADVVAKKEKGKGDAKFGLPRFLAELVMYAGASFLIATTSADLVESLGMVTTLAALMSVALAVLIIRMIAEEKGHEKQALNEGLSPKVNWFRFVVEDAGESRDMLAAGLFAGLITGAALISAFAITLSFATGSGEWMRVFFFAIPLFISTGLNEEALRLARMDAENDNGIRAREVLNPESADPTAGTWPRLRAFLYGGSIAGAAIVTLMVGGSAWMAAWVVAVGALGFFAARAVDFIWSNDIEGRKAAWSWRPWRGMDIGLSDAYVGSAAVLYFVGAFAVAPAVAAMLPALGLTGGFVGALAIMLIPLAAGLPILWNAREKRVGAGIASAIAKWRGWFPWARTWKDRVFAPTMGVTAEELSARVRRYGTPMGRIAEVLAKRRGEVFIPDSVLNIREVMGHLDKYVEANDVDDDTPEFLDLGEGITALDGNTRLELAQRWNDLRTAVAGADERVRSEALDALDDPNLERLLLRAIHQHNESTRAKDVKVKSEEPAKTPVDETSGDPILELGEIEPSLTAFAGDPTMIVRIFMEAMAARENGRVVALALAATIRENVKYSKSAMNAFADALDAFGSGEAGLEVFQPLEANVLPALAGQPKLMELFLKAAGTKQVRPDSASVREFQQLADRFKNQIPALAGEKASVTVRLIAYNGADADRLAFSVRTDKATPDGAVKRIVLYATQQAIDKITRVSFIADQLARQGLDLSKDDVIDVEKLALRRTAEEIAAAIRIRRDLRETLGKKVRLRLAYDDEKRIAGLQAEGFVMSKQELRFDESLAGNPKTPVIVDKSVTLNQLANLLRNRKEANDESPIPLLMTEKELLEKMKWAGTGKSNEQATDLITVQRAWDRFILLDKAPGTGAKFERNAYDAAGNIDAAAIEHLVDQYALSSKINRSDIDSVSLLSSAKRSIVGKTDLKMVLLIAFDVQILPFDSDGLIRTTQVILRQA